MQNMTDLPFTRFSNLSAVKIIISKHATKQIENWPNKPRSRRLVKKLTKLRGPQITYKPCAIRTAMGLIVQPAIYDQLRKED
ncbi:hypothetical protein [Gemmobacter denitrificans]|uniref:Uncharacterized protein n=1 Tax=Gemmobacter denitrificans TaxID=3123040 RepID=A0ABU8BSG7_9RHOB